MNLFGQTTEVEALLSAGMGPGLHWFPGDVHPARLAAVLAGMANGQGGTVVLGVAPRSAQVIGVADIDRALDVVFQASLLIDPPLVLPMPRRVEAAPRGGVESDARPTVLIVSVPPGLPNVYGLEGRYLGRDGAQTNPLSARRLRQLLMERGAIQFEAQIAPGASPADLDPDGVAAYVRTLNRPGEESPEKALLRRGCLKPDSAKRLSDQSLDLPECLRPTYAGILLFGQEPQRWLHSARILAARFSGTAVTDRFIKQEIEGPLPDQLRRAEAFLMDHLPSVVRIEGLEHIETPLYPLEALREVLVNAVVHRDYNMQGDLIHINIYTDRIEIHSPGGLPGPVTLKNLLEARFSRNPILLQVMADMGFVERLGYGLNRVVESLRSRGMRPPRFEEIGGSFRVTLYAPAETQPGLDPGLPARFRSLDLNPRQQEALQFILRNRRITNREYQDLCPQVHSETLRRDLADLVDRGLLIKVGDKRSTYYILKRGA